MALRLYNTLTRRKEVFAPLDPDRVRMYVCGPTVYDRAHIGNARPVIVFDVLFRLLRHLYGAEHVAYARNITDIDDKIIARAAERGTTIRALTEGTAAGFAGDVEALGCLLPTVEPRATDHIPEMIAVVERLVAGGHAYAPVGEGGEGHVLFAVGSMPDYGQLSHRTLDEMLAGARVEVAPYKRADGDFVLWKPSAPDEPGWNSPWGRGRPGWHLECSAMSWKHLGEEFDIHGGGLDLIFPHHENELAQSCCAFHRPRMAQVWMHNGFLQVEGQKMSKSLGNFVTIQDLLATEGFGGRRWPGEVLRLAMLRTHYRQPIDWTVKALMESANILMDWASVARYDLMPESDVDPSTDVVAALTDDLNTPEAIAFINRLSRKALTDTDAATCLASTLVFLGLDIRLVRSYKENIKISMERYNKDMELLSKYAGRVTVREAHDMINAGVDFQSINSLIEDRLAARHAKNFAESDRLRDDLAKKGFGLKDNKDGTTSWTVGRRGTA